MKIHTRMLIACQWRIPENKRTIADFNLTSGDLLLGHSKEAKLFMSKTRSRMETLFSKEIQHDLDFHVGILDSLCSCSNCGIYDMENGHPIIL